MSDPLLVCNALALIHVMDTFSSQLTTLSEKNAVSMLLLLPIIGKSGIEVQLFIYILSPRKICSDQLSPT